MAGFTDLVLRAQPALVSVEASATEGRSWRFEFADVTDTGGTPVDLSTAVGVCAILTAVDGTTVASPAFVGGVGTFTLTLDEADTVDLAAGSTRRMCVWGLVVTMAGDSVQFFGPFSSRFMIEPE